MTFAWPWPKIIYSTTLFTRSAFLPLCSSFPAKVTVLTTILGTERLKFVKSLSGLRSMVRARTPPAPEVERSHEEGPAVFSVYRVLLHSSDGANHRRTSWEISRYRFGHGQEQRPPAY